MVRAVAKIYTRHRAYMLAGILKSVLWVLTVLLVWTFFTIDTSPLHAFGNGTPNKSVPLINTSNVRIFELAATDNNNPLVASLGIMLFILNYQTLYLLTGYDPP